MVYPSGQYPGDYEWTNPWTDEVVSLPPQNTWRPETAGDLLSLEDLLKAHYHLRRFIHNVIESGGADPNATYPRGVNPASCLSVGQITFGAALLADTAAQAIVQYESRSGNERHLGMWFGFLTSVRDALA